MRKRALFIVIMLVISNIIFTSCSVEMGRDIGDNSDNNEYEFLNNNMDDVLDTGPVKGGILNLFSTSPDTLNPILTNNAYVKDYSCFIYESLVTLDKNQKPVPMLSESWEVSGDRLVWTFKIRDNVFWHDNIPFTAEDVEFTVSTILNSTVNSPYKVNLKNITAFSAEDLKTFRVILKSPNSFTPELMTFPIIPKHYFLGEDITNSPKNNKPIGTGPFKFVEYKENEYIKYRNNEKWWNGQVVDENGNTIPYIAEIVIKIFGKNRSVANAFQSRDVDLITMDRESYRRYSGRSDITLKKYPGKKFEFIAFNLSNKILREKEVRRAIAYAVDKVKIINDIMPGEAIASDIPVIPDTWLYDTNILSYNVDREKAKKLLEDSGWKDNNGVLYKRINGVNTPLNLEMLVNDDNEVRIQAAEKVKGQLKEIGINLEIKKIKWDDEFKKIYSGKYDMVFLGCTIASIPDISFLYASSQIGTGLNIAGYRNENIDWYLYQILFESDSSRRKAYFINMKEILNQDMPYLGMYFYNDAVMYNKRIRGDLNPSVWNKYNDFIKWYIPVN